MADRNKFIDDLIDLGASDEEVAEALRLADERGEFGKASAPRKGLPLSFGGRLTEAGAEPFKKMRETAESVAKGETSFSEGALRSVGDIVGGAGNVGFEYARSLTPGFVKKGLKKFADATDLTRDLARLNEDIQPVVSKYPNTARNVGAIVNIIGALPAVKAPSIATKAGGSAVKDVAKGLGADKALESFAVRSQARQVKINSPEWARGARPELNAKYGVIGKKAEDAAGQWQALEDAIIENLSPRVKSSLNDPSNVTAISALKKHAYDVINRSNVSQDEKLLQLASVDDVINRWSSVYPDGKIDILEAQKLKIEQGRQGNWKSTGMGSISNPKAPIEAKAHNAIYDALKTNVENKGSAGIKELNNALSEIIPMKLSAEKRIMVDKRSNFTSLDDVVAVTTALASAAHGNPLGLIYAGGSIAAKSPLTSKIAYKAAQSIRGESVPRGIKAIQDAMALPLKTSKPLPATPAYFRAGIRPETKTKVERLALPPPMIGTPRGPVAEMTHRNAIREQLYNTGIEPNRTADAEIQRSIKKINAPLKMPKGAVDLIKKIKPPKDEGGFIGTKSNLDNARFDRFMGKPISPQAEAMIAPGKNINELRTTLEKLNPAQRSEIIKRLQKIYGEKEWKKIAPLLGTLGAAGAVSGAGVAAMEIFNR